MVIDLKVSELAGIGLTPDQFHKLFQTEKRWAAAKILSKRPGNSQLITMLEGGIPGVNQFTITQEA